LLQLAGPNFFSVLFRKGNRIANRRLYFIPIRAMTIRLYGVAFKASLTGQQLFTFMDVCNTMLAHRRGHITKSSQAQSVWQ
jgi:hypothetical protein